VTPKEDWHSIVSDVDEENRTADCSKCGPATRVWRSGGRREKWICATVIRDARAANPDRVRDGQLKVKFGISLEEWEARFDAQGRRCAICGTDEPGGRGWATDHDHSCCPGGKSCGACLRDILCQGCNKGIGHLQEDPAILAASLEYLMRHNCQKC
jgi:hypothetical protein